MHALGAATLPVGSGVLALVVLALASSQVLPGASADGCSHPPPAAGFNQSQYRGVWYEIAKIQTAGGAFFEKDCVCTQLNVRADAGGPASNLLVDNLCRKDTPAGELLNFTGTLQNATAPGQWQEVRVEQSGATRARASRRRVLRDLRAVTCPGRSQTLT